MTFDSSSGMWRYFEACIVYFPLKLEVKAGAEERYCFGYDNFLCTSSEMVVACNGDLSYYHPSRPLPVQRGQLPHIPLRYTQFTVKCDTLCRRAIRAVFCSKLHELKMISIHVRTSFVCVCVYSSELMKRKFGNVAEPGAGEGEWIECGNRFPYRMLPQPRGRALHSQQRR